ncbi:MAG: hypothetical protein IPL33_14665 [Sphingobacteriales bacterium]|nr:hypothetical protein [Sphingobacteriales bacterium]
MMDGTPIELYWWDGKKFRRESVFLVIDACTWAVLGWCFGTESKETILLALRHPSPAVGRNAPSTCNWTTSSGAWNAAMISVVQTDDTIRNTAQVGNAKAKVVESWFSHFHLRVLKVHFDGFAGMNVTAKSPDNPSHYEWLKANCKLPQATEACIAQIEQAFGIWNQQHKVAIGKTAPQTPHSRLQAVPHRARLLCLEEEMSLFWLWLMDRDEKTIHVWAKRHSLRPTPNALRVPSI